MSQSYENTSIKFHIDVNSAYLSWTAIQLLKEGNATDIRTIPAIIGGDQETRHGIVIAKSIPAKAYGIQTAETVASAFKKCPSLKMLAPDHHYYIEQSHALMDYLSSICPVIEQVSIDECYMSYAPLIEQFPDPVKAAYYIKDHVRDDLGFTVNIGISDKKVLAKMASDFKKPDRVHTLFSDEIQHKLWPLAIGRLHMCGKQSAARFQQYGIQTIGDLAKTDPLLVSSWMKSHGALLWNYANGIDDDEVVTDHGPAKGVGNSTTLAKNAETAEEAYKVLMDLSESVSSRLKKKGFQAGQVSVEIKYATFTSASHQTTLPSPSNDKKQIYTDAVTLFDELWNGEAIRLLGIRTTKLSTESAPRQLNFEDYMSQISQMEEQKRHLEKERQKIQLELQKENEKNIKKQKLDDALQKLKSKYGEDIISRGM